MMAAKRVLVVEDDASIRETLELVLEEEGYDVRGAPDGRMALEVSAHWHPNLILLDMKMPVMNGWQMAAEYRLRPEPRAPIVVLTAAQDAARWAQEISADGVLPKPFELDQLLEIVSRHTKA